MCGRFTQKADKKTIEKEFKVDSFSIELLKPRFNIAPTQMIPAVLETDGERVLANLKWGLIPSWAKDDSFASKTINARAETLYEKASFKNAFKSRRCIVPTTGFYEWEKKAKGTKQPYFFYLPEREVFGFAGLYEEWLDKETGELVETCTIITTEANKVLEPVHDRMLVILKSEDYSRWLDTKEKDTGKLQSLLVPYPADEMDSYAVGLSVNSPSNDTDELIQRMNSK